MSLPVAAQLSRARASLKCANQKPFWNLTAKPHLPPPQFPGIPGDCMNFFFLSLAITFNGGILTSGRNTGQPASEEFVFFNQRRQTLKSCLRTGGQHSTILQESNSWVVNPTKSLPRYLSDCSKFKQIIKPVSKQEFALSLARLASLTASDERLIRTSTDTRYPAHSPLISASQPATQVHEKYK